MIITIRFFKSNGQSTETMCGKFLNISLKPVLNVFDLVVSAKLNNDSGHTLCNVLEFARGFLVVDTFSMFVDGVERLELENLNPSMSLEGIRDRIDDTHVDGILVFSMGSIHWGQGHLETGDYMLGTFRAHVHLSHNVTGG